MNVQFRHEIFRPRLGPIIAAILTVAVAILCARPFLEANLELTLDGPQDIQGYASVRYQKPRSQATVLNLGGSGFLRALPEDFRLEAQFRDEGLRFVSVNYGWQTMAESLLLLREARLGRGDLVVVHSSLSRINRVKPDVVHVCSPYLHTIYHRELAEVLRELDVHETPVNALCAATLFAKSEPIRNVLRNRWNTLKGQPVAQFEGIYPMPYETNSQQLEKMRERSIRRQRSTDFARRWLEFNAESAESFVDALKAMRRAADERGIRMIVIDTPQNVSWYERHHEYMDEPFAAAYAKVVQRVVSAGIPYFDMRRHPAFTYEDFRDHQHMVPSGREKFLPIYRRLVLDAIGRAAS